MIRFGKITNRKSFTLYELILTFILLAILAASSIAGAYYFLQTGLFAPNQLDVYLVADDIMDIIVEGDPAATGLRFAKRITAADNTSITFNDSDDNPVNFAWSSVDDHIRRDGVEIPYYIRNDMEVLAVGGVIFTYYDSDENVITTPVAAENLHDIKRIRVSFTVNTGTGSFERWEGSCTLETSVYTKYYWTGT